MNDHHENPLPPAALFGVAALIGFALIAVAGFTLLHQPRSVDNVTSAIKTRDLRFVDLGAGEVAVQDWPGGRRVATLAPGSENFIRGVLRGLARERRSIGIGDTEPFRITRFADGRLTLEDRATGRILFLNAFGPTNVGAFAQLLDGENSAAITPDSDGKSRDS